MANRYVEAAKRLFTRWGTPPVSDVRPFAEQGSAGTPVFGGYVVQRDSSPKWTGAQRWRIAAELATNTAVVTAGIHYFLNLISSPKWSAQPKRGMEQSGAAKEMADFVNDVLGDTDTDWHSIVRQAGIFRFHGFVIQEWIAKKRPDGKIGLRNIEHRPQHTIEQWAVDDFGTVLGMFQRNPQTNSLLSLPRGKLWYITENLLTDSPEGLGVFRHLAEPFERLKRLQELEVRAYERDLRGIPVGKAPLSKINEHVKAGLMTEAQAQALISGMQSMIQTQVKQSDTGLLFDSIPYESTSIGGPIVSNVPMWDFSLLSGPGLGLVEIDKAIERVQREMARVMGIDHIMLGDGGGSRAVAQDKSRNIYLIASAVLRMIVASCKKDVLNQLWILNGFDEELKPNLVAEDIAPRDVVEVATTLARMSQAGATLAPDDPVVNDVRDMLGVAHAPVEEEEPEGLGIPGLPQLDENGQPMIDEAGNPVMDPATMGGPPPPPNPMMGNQNQRNEQQRLPRTTVANADPVVR